MRYFQGYSKQTMIGWSRGILVLPLILIYTSHFAQVDHMLEVMDSNVVVTTRLGQLHGSYMRPRQHQSGLACLIIAGSGPTDRNGNGPSINTNAYSKLAAHLADMGYASLRFDKRGIGASKQAALTEDSVRFEDGIKDAQELIQWLRIQPGINRVVVIGHSEGSLIGMMASRGVADAFISVAGPGRPADVILKEQLGKQLPPENLVEANRVIDDMKAGRHPEQVPFWLMSIARPSVQNYVISWFKYDPRIEIAKLEIPICILQGGRDQQVQKEDGWLLAEAAPTGIFNFINNMNHVLVDVEDMDAQNSASYRQPELPLSKTFLTALDDFFKKLN